MLFYAVVELKNHNTPVFVASAALATAFLTERYPDATFRESEGTTWVDAEVPGMPGKDPHAVAHFYPKWVWDRLPTTHEMKRVNRLLEYRTEMQRVHHLAFLMDENWNSDAEDGDSPDHITIRGTELIKEILAWEAKVQYCGACPSRGGKHKFGCPVHGARAGQVVLPVTRSPDGTLTVTGPLASTLPAPPEKPSE